MHGPGLPQGPRCNCDACAARWLLPAGHRPGPCGRLAPQQLSGMEARPPGTDSSWAPLPGSPLHARFLRTHYAQGSVSTHDTAGPAGHLPSRSKASKPPLSLSSSIVLQDTRGSEDKHESRTWGQRGQACDSSVAVSRQWGRGRSQSTLASERPRFGGRWTPCRKWGRAGRAGEGSPAPHSPSSDTQD